MLKPKLFPGIEERTRCTTVSGGAGGVEGDLWAYRRENGSRTRLFKLDI
jgi:hypothetical protein